MQLLFPPAVLMTQQPKNPTPEVFWEMEDPRTEPIPVAAPTGLTALDLDTARVIYDRQASQALAVKVLTWPFRDVLGFGISAGLAVGGLVVYAADMAQGSVLVAASVPLAIWVTRGALLFRRAMTKALRKRLDTEVVALARRDGRSVTAPADDEVDS